MITAKNYAAQAEKEITRSYSQSPIMAKEFPLIQKRFLDPIKNSVHFALPDTGVIFDDQYRGIRGEEVRLPFPSITVEYYFPYGIQELEKDYVWSSKRLILATEYTTEAISLEYPEFDFEIGDPDMIWIAVYGASYFPDESFWAVEPFGWLMPAAWDGKFSKKDGTAVFQNSLNVSVEWQGGTHRSPRQHLRRGHIRNLQSGKKVWVNATVVGSRDNGVINKAYGIKKLETA
jgi:hypothetical protein